MMPISLDERETTITYDAVEKVANIYTCIPADIRKLDKLCADHPDTYTCVWEDTLYYAKKYRVASNRIRFSKPPSEAQRAAGRERWQKSLKKHVGGRVSED